MILGEGGGGAPPSEGQSPLGKKRKYNEKVRICRYFSAGKCIFGSEKCWYKHDKLENDSNEKVTVENQELWDKLLSMMEQMTERITLMENHKEKQLSKQMTISKQ